MFRANTVYEGTYLLGTSIARPLISKRQIEIAKETGADAVWRGSVLRFLTDTDYPPFNYYDEDGSLVGFNIDVARAICLELDVHFKIVTYYICSYIIVFPIYVSCHYISLFLGVYGHRQH